MIPKIIHYCWFGGNALPPLYVRCMESWKKHMPDYEIMRWDESNVIPDDYIAYHLKKKNWAFVSDYVRLQKLLEFGGVYLDTDIEVVKSFDALLDEPLFIGEEDIGRLNTAVVGAKSDHYFVSACLNEMSRRHRQREAFLIAPELTSHVFNMIGKPDIKIMPYQTFYPYNPYRKDSLPILMYSDITDETYAIHHWGKSWNESFVHKVIRKLKYVLAK